MRLRSRSVPTWKPPAAPHGPPSQGRGSCSVKLPCREVHIQRPLPRTPYKRTKEGDRDQVGKRRKNGRKVTHRETAEHPCSGAARVTQRAASPRQVRAQGRGTSLLPRDSLPRELGRLLPAVPSSLKTFCTECGVGSLRQRSGEGQLPDWANGATLSSDFQEQVAGLPPGSRAARSPETPTAFWGDLGRARF